MGFLRIDFNHLYEDYNKLVFQIAFRITKNKTVSEDIVQETFLKAYKKLDTLSEQEKAGSWLSAIATRTSIDFLRKEIRAREVLLDPFTIELNGSIVPAGESVQESVDIMLLKQDIETHIKQLPVAQQEVFMLRIQYGMNEEEIAKKLDLKKSTVKTRFFRARKKLKHMYKLKCSA
ncbi:RNA polymerase sigma factor [Rossellomorea vietnamensis]|uniref:RNA polymerase sigma factor n=1 Tax=Rossellomorea vietnamensis TaxID=218284 RepID=A0A5D4NVC2_9BACI|nr:RNA polymerase sigma factor [Rossellomorea vietnamensis]